MMAVKNVYGAQGPSLAWVRGNASNSPAHAQGERNEAALLKAGVSKSNGQDFPGGAVVKNPSAHAGDTGLSPGPGRSHMPRCN